jgi:hypothetical protein
MSFKTDLSGARRVGSAFLLFFILAIEAVIFAAVLQSYGWTSTYVWLILAGVLVATVILYRSVLQGKPLRSRSSGRARAGPRVKVAVNNQMVIIIAILVVGALLWVYKSFLGDALMEWVGIAAGMSTMILMFSLIGAVIGIGVLLYSGTPPTMQTIILAIGIGLLLGAVLGAIIYSIFGALFGTVFGGGSSGAGSFWDIPIFPWNWFILG